MKGVFIIPTGLGCALGGDAAYLPGVKLISKCVDKLIVNPNAVNASDVNEIPENCLYTEGSIIDRFLEGQINLKETHKYNKILQVVNGPVTPASINAGNAGIWGLGADIQIVELNTPLIMNATMNPDGTAGGTVTGWSELCDQVQAYNYDALAIHTVIECDRDVADAYWRGEIRTNPWGAVEATASKLIADRLNKPVAHAPVDWIDQFPITDTVRPHNKQVVGKQQALEIISTTYLFCVLKGLHRAPKVDLEHNPNNLSYDQIDFLISPYGCWGRPHKACAERNIPIIIVKENTTCLENFSYPEDTHSAIFVENYLEAAGVLMSWNAGVDHKQITL